MITFEEYLYNRICRWPTLYAQKTLEESKISVLDHLLNVIGNGIRDDQELQDQIDIEPGKKESALRYIHNDIYSAYDRTKDINIDCLDYERINYPGVRFIKSEKRGVSLYPNFQERYSTLYCCPWYLTLPNDWIEAAIFFYEWSKERFVSGIQKHYRSWPSERPGISKLDWTKTLSKYKTNEEISRAYNCEYSGDLEDFLCRLRDKEFARVISFIDKSLDILRKNLK